MNEKRISGLLFFAMVVFLAIKCVPSDANKNAGPLYLSAPVETPNGVHFSWSAGRADTTYSIMRRQQGAEDWERIVMGLTGVSGAADAEGFTLDRTFEYKIQAEQ